MAERFRLSKDGREAWEIGGLRLAERVGVFDPVRRNVNDPAVLLPNRGAAIV
jgi:hypothetical protein